MKDEVYDYLKEYGFSADLLQEIEDNNEYIFYMSLNNAKDNIEFFKNLGYTKEEYIQLVKDNYFNLTLSSKRKKAFEEIYINKLNLSNSDLKYLLSINNQIYTCSPIELDKNINYLLVDKQYSKEFIKNIILSNPKLVNKKIDEIINLL